MRSLCPGGKAGPGRPGLLDIASKASGQSWSMTSYCPVPGPVPASPANRDYQPGFAAGLMLKDLTWPCRRRGSVHADTPLGDEGARPLRRVVRGRPGRARFFGYDGAHPRLGLQGFQRVRHLANANLEQGAVLCLLGQGDEAFV
ncbi:MAG: NAD-binding protein [Asticcacaulis sp.]